MEANRGVIKKGWCIWCGITGDRYFAANGSGSHSDWSLFACPVNVIVLVVYIIALVAMHLLRKRVYLFGWLSHYSGCRFFLGMGSRHDGDHGTYPAGSFRSRFQ